MELCFSTNIFKPTLLQVSFVVLDTREGQTIQIELLQPVETRIDEHIMEVKGMSYDIFATPNEKKFLVE
jgi:hypothetical protein